ncbi:MAG: MurT ligase domain-containing protein [Bifidobacteriaceae bacterium]|jgi:UDP-N-acetylmuramyl tripeptide synthase|nr:MurT ligase domain-containing protein [Bifidobacteriaceae bacterium]MCI1979228.1 MurT ligase domain-containing protein [Bifidobacteriaceae bacterium]
MTSSPSTLRQHLTPALGKAVRAVARLRGGGSALPGKVVESFDPNFMGRTLSQLPLGVLMVSGTNGKTTTTRMIAKTLENLGLKVFTNPTGSNFTRGVVSALIPLVDSRGHLDADIAVLELDEAYAVHFVKQVKPRYAVLLNVMRDQLDRFGEIDNTARLLSHVAEATTDTLVLNREDRRIAALAKGSHASNIRYFGLATNLRSSFPTDDELHASSDASVSAEDAASADGHPDHPGLPPVASSENFDIELAVQAAAAENPLPADVTLCGVHPHSAEFMVGTGGSARKYSTELKVSGIYNLFNAAAAVSVIRAVIAAASSTHPRLAATTTEELLQALSTVTPAFGRGENIDVDGTPVELVLVKNPAGFRLALASFSAADADTMIAINDDYADGRDMSWLWDVDFTSLRAQGVAMVSGVRSWDMALRLGYDEVGVAKVEPSLKDAVDEFVHLHPGVHKRIYCTYTAMLDIRKHLGELTTVTDVGV